MTNTANTKTPNQNGRPYYKKKRVLIPAGILILGIIGAQMDKDKEANTNSLTTIEQRASSGLTPGMDLKTKISNNIKSIDGGDDLTKTK